MYFRMAINKLYKLLITRKGFCFPCDSCYYVFIYLAEDVSITFIYLSTVSSDL